MRVHHVKAARRDYPDQDIKKGESYYWWKFRYGGKRRQKTYPKKQQLTQSDFYISVYDCDDSINGDLPQTLDEVSDKVSEYVQMVEEIRDEQQEKLDAMPEQLQESSVINERIEQLEEWISNLENISYDGELTDEDMEGENSDDYQTDLENIQTEISGACPL